MVVKLNSKKKVVSEIRKSLEGAICVILIDYRGLKSFQMMEIRRVSRVLNVKYSVVRNTLAKIALKDTNYSSLVNFLRGPVLLVFSYEEPVNISKLLNEFSNNRVKLNVKAFCFESCDVNLSGLDGLISVPSYIESISKLIFIINYPIKMLINVILGPYVKFINLLNVICVIKKSS